MPSHTALVPLPAAARVLERPTTRPGARFVLVGGVPGAGKSTLLARSSLAGEQVRSLDPDRHRRSLAARLPAWMPYRAYRGLVHAAHALATVGLLLRGPRSSEDVLVVHEPATRPRRREALALLARVRGWDPILVMLDVSEQQALAGQHQRGRVVRGRSFARHWVRWTAQREQLHELARQAQPLAAWSSVHVVERDTAMAVLYRLTGHRQPVEAAPAEPPSATGLQPRCA